MRLMRMVRRGSRFCGSVALAALVASCDRTGSKDFLGSAVVEVQTYQVSATVQGQIVAAYKDEGSSVQLNELVAIIDSVPFTLKLGELAAVEAELMQTIGSNRAQQLALAADLDGAKRERDRMASLVQKSSAPQQQLDMLTTQYQAGTQKISAADKGIAALSARRVTIGAQRAQVLDNIRRCYILAPCKGMVLTQYKSRGEVAGPSTPIYELGSYDTVQIDFFVPQPLLADLKLGQPVRIRVDSGQRRTGKESGVFVPAAVTWISSDAEFSPKNIQTRETRNELVFRVRAKAVNADQTLKRGLPVEVWK